MEVYNNCLLGEALDSYMVSQTPGNLQKLIDISIGGNSVDSDRIPIKVTITKFDEIVELDYVKTLDAVITGPLQHLPLRSSQTFNLSFAAYKRYEDNQSGGHQFSAQELNASKPKAIRHSKIPNLLLGRFGGTTIEMDTFIFFPELYLENHRNDVSNNGSLGPSGTGVDLADDKHRLFVDKILIPSVKKITYLCGYPFNRLRALSFGSSSFCEDNPGEIHWVFSS